MNLSTKVEDLTRVGKTTASRLHRLGLYTARDLLFHFPNRYEDWTQSTTISKLRPLQDTSITGKVASIRNFRSSRRGMNITEAFVEDDTGSIKVIWFNQPFLTKNLPTGTKVSLSGKAELQGRELIMKSPKYEIVQDDRSSVHTGRLLPIYPLALNLTQKQIQFLINHVLHLAQTIKDPLPEVIRKDQGFPDLSTTLQYIHQPESMDQVKLAHKRLAFEEVFYLQLQAATLRELNEGGIAVSLQFYEEEIKKFVESLPFELTDDQKRTTWKTILDLQEEKPMNRLVQGDVGSGKTVVAALAMYNVALNGYQSVLMAPTEVLASQHFKSFVDLFRSIDLPIALFTRSQQKIAHKGEVTDIKKKDLMALISKGEVAIAIGTHAVIQPEVEFRQLGLAVVDEQHRFGVEQRKALRMHSGDDETMPHLLSMTATPIPRTLTLVFYGDLSVSSIREMPKDRLPIKTKVVAENKRQDAYQFVWDEVQKGSQVFVVCPLIEESDKLGVTSVAEESAKLVKVFPKAQIASLHGKLSSTEKEDIMMSFKDHKIDILVATTVIEVGVDVPNATIMVIEGAERFGLSQLHQIRGRVGRGTKQSYCFLCPTDPQAIGRLQQFVKCKDGFEVSELDLRIRGAGEVFGTKQSGLVELQFVDITDTGFVEKVNDAAIDFLDKHTIDDFPILKNHIDDLNKRIHLE